MKLCLKSADRELVEVKKQSKVEREKHDQKCNDFLQKVKHVKLVKQTGNGLSREWVCQILLITF